MVSIITISYNTSQLLQECLASLYKNLNAKKFEAIVVDNDSKDDSVAAVKKNFPKAKVIETHENLGFARGCNRGAEAAHGDVFLFLNSDASISDASIFEMETFLMNNKDAGIVGGLLLNQDTTPQRSFSTFYDISHVTKLLFGGDRAELSSQNLEKSKKVDWVSGGFMMVKKEVFEKLGGFDKNIFMYIEDMELCYRAKKDGYTVYFYPQARAVHVGQGSSNRTFAIIHIYRGLLYFYKKHKSYPEYLTVKFLLILKGVLAIGIGIVTLNKSLISRYTQAIQF